MTILQLIMRLNDIADNYNGCCGLPVSTPAAMEEMEEVIAEFVKAQEGEA